MRVGALLVWCFAAAGCSLVTTLDGLDEGAGGSGGPSSSSGTSASSGSSTSSSSGAAPEGGASSSSSSSGSSSSSSSTSSSSSSSGAPCTVTTTPFAGPGSVVMTGSGQDWTGLDGAKTEGDGGALTLLDGAKDQSRALVAQGFRLNVPATAQIRGVAVRIRAKSAVTGAGVEPKDVRDEKLQLTQGGTLTGANTVPSQDEWSASYTYHEAGGPTTTWGVALSPALVNSDDFGVGYVTRFHGNVATDTASLDVDLIQLAVTYCN